MTTPTETPSDTAPGETEVSPGRRSLGDGVLADHLVAAHRAAGTPTPPAADQLLM